MDADEAITIGRRVKLIRKARGKPLRVVAELAGMSRATLEQIESGQRALDKRSEIVALSNVLQIAPSELTMLPVPAPADGDTDSAVDEVRRALMAVGCDRPGGHVVSIDELRARVRTVERSDYDSRGVALPTLIRDLHSTRKHSARVRGVLRGGAG